MLHYPHDMRELTELETIATQTDEKVVGNSSPSQASKRFAATRRRIRALCLIWWVEERMYIPILFYIIRTHTYTIQVQHKRKRGAYLWTSLLVPLGRGEKHPPSARRTRAKAFTCTVLRT